MRERGEGDGEEEGEGGERGGELVMYLNCIRSNDFYHFLMTSITF